MGNSKSNTAQKKNVNSQLKPALKKTTVSGPVNGYNYSYPYIPGQYVYPAYPKVNEQPNPTNYQNYDPVHHSHGYHYQYHGQLTPYGHNHPPHHHHRHHHHHHHHHRSPSPVEKEHVNPPTLQNRANSPRSQQPSVQAQRPVSTIITTKVTSPAPNTEVRPSAPPPVSHSPFGIAQNPPFSMVEKDNPPPQLVTPKSIPPSVLITSNSFEKAPIIETNYVPKSPDSHSIHHHGSDTISIVRRSGSRYVPSGNRWYDHEYDKRIKALTIKDD